MIELPLRGAVIRDKQLVIPLGAEVLEGLKQRVLTPRTLILDDGRTITDKQRKKVYALLRDISLYSGHDRAYTKEYFKAQFCFVYDLPMFSLSTVDRTTARKFIDFLIWFMVSRNIPCQNRLAELCEAEDIDRYLYYCLLYKQCCVCGRRGDHKAFHFHHCGESRTGMGRKATEIPLPGLWGMALCWEHHDEIHQGPEQEFFEKYHVYPIRVDQKIAEQYGHYRRDVENDVGKIMG